MKFDVFLIKMFSNLIDEILYNHQYFFYMQLLDYFCFMNSNFFFLLRPENFTFKKLKTLEFIFDDNLIKLVLTPIF